LKDQKTFESYLEKLTPDQKKVIETLLEERKNKLSDFYTKSQDENLEVEEIKGKKFVIINNDDDFVFMLKYMITRMGGEVEVIENEKFNKEKISDDTIVVLGP